MLYPSTRAMLYHSTRAMLCEHPKFDGRSILPQLHQSNLDCGVITLSQKSEDQQSIFSQQCNGRGKTRNLNGWHGEILQQCHKEQHPVITLDHD